MGGVSTLSSAYRSIARESLQDSIAGIRDWLSTAALDGSFDGPGKRDTERCAEK